MKARNYYYDYFAPNEKGKSYQKVHQKKQFKNSKNRLAKKIYNHIPQRSNDKLIENHLKEIINLNNREVESRIENMFVAKILSFEANAFALESRKRYWSDLVFFHVGLSDVCFQSCINFMEFQILRDGTDKALVGNPLFISKVFKNSIDLNGNFAKWKDNDKYIELEVDTVITGFNENIDSKVASLATFLDKFILAHEISHHLLNHTGRSHDFKNYLEIVPTESLIWKKSINQSHINEFEADSFAILLLLGKNPSNYKEKVKLTDQFQFEVSFGVIFTLEVISLISEKEEISSTHPPILERLYNAKVILSEFISEKPYNAAERSVSDYIEFIEEIKK